MLDLQRLEGRISELEPAVARLLRTYVDEAFFFEEIIRPDIQLLPRDATVVEVGGGIGLLALLLGSQDLKITVFEPEGAGFGQMATMREVILDCWVGTPAGVTWINRELNNEDVSLGLQADFVYAINVIEHVPETRDFVSVVMNVLKKDGEFRFICPNYAVPYEPHFNFPTLFRKSWTERAMGRRIGATPISNPRQFWDDLSWPTPRSLRQLISSLGYEPIFSRVAVMAYIKRAQESGVFLERKGRIGRYLLRPVARVGGFLLSILPIGVVPIIDCRVRKGDIARSRY